MKRLLNICICCALAVTLMLLNTIGVSAKSTNTYSYSEEEPKQSPDACVAEKSISGTDIGCGAFNSPQDICIFGEEIYIADSGNNRIVVTDKNFKFIKEIKSIILNGNESLLSQPKGLFVSENEICISDTGNARVIVLDKAGNILTVLEKPKSDLYDESLQFQPQKVLKDKNGFYYVINLGNYEGALLYNPDGTFNCFFGGNKVAVTVTVLIENAWRQLMNKTQLSRIEQNIPQEYCNFDIDSDGFIYTCTSNTTETVDQLKKLNPNGDNIWESGINYGDTAEVWDGSTPIVTRIADISADGNGFVTAIDSQYGHIFQYSATDGRILFVTGNIGSQTGTFATPSAIESDESHIYIVDSAKSTVTVFGYTEYGKDVRNAVMLYNDGKYDKALEYWNSVIRKNGNMQIAYVGIGKALAGKKNYTEAMEYFKLGMDKEGYSDAFSLYRKNILQSNFTWILILVVMLLIAGYSWGYVSKKRKKVDYTIKHYKKWQYPFYVAFHPAKGFDDLKWSKQTSFTASVIILALWFMSSVLKRQQSAFLFNEHIKDKADFNIFVQALSTIGLFATFVVINWALCTLFEGKGTMKNIWIYSSYALLPIILSNYIWVALSYVFTLQEGTFLAIINVICIIWALVLLLRGLSVLHEYELKKVIVSLLATVFGMAIVVFLLVLVISLFNRITSFVTAIIDEIIMHSAM